MPEVWDMEAKLALVRDALEVACDEIDLGSIELAAEGTPDVHLRLYWNDGLMQTLMLHNVSL